MPDAEIKASDVLWRLNEINGDINRRLATIEAHLVGHFVERSVYEADKRTHEADMRAMQSLIAAVREETMEVKESNTWLRRVVASGFIVFLFGLISALLLVAVQ